jgi:hypothetical protein
VKRLFLFSMGVLLFSVIQPVLQQDAHANCLRNLISSSSSTATAGGAAGAYVEEEDESVRPAVPRKTPQFDLEQIRRQVQEGEKIDPVIERGWSANEPILVHLIQLTSLSAKQNRDRLFSVINGTVDASRFGPFGPAEKMEAGLVVLSGREGRLDLHTDLHTYDALVRLQRVVHKSAPKRQEVFAMTPAMEYGIDQDVRSFYQALEARGCNDWMRLAMLISDLSVEAPWTRSITLEDRDRLLLLLVEPFIFLLSSEEEGATAASSRRLTGDEKSLFSRLERVLTKSSSPSAGNHPTFRYLGNSEESLRVLRSVRDWCGIG